MASLFEASSQASNNAVKGIVNSSMQQAASIPAGRGQVQAAAQAGGLLSRGVQQVMGNGTPEEARAMAKQISMEETNASGVTFGSPEYFQVAAQNLAKNGLQEEALQAVQMGQEVLKNQASIASTQANTAETNIDISQKNVLNPIEAKQAKLGLTESIATSQSNIDKANAEAALALTKADVAKGTKLADIDKAGLENEKIRAEKALTLAKTTRERLNGGLEPNSATAKLGLDITNAINNGDMAGLENLSSKMAIDGGLMTGGFASKLQEGIKNGELFIRSVEDGVPLTRGDLAAIKNSPGLVENFKSFAGGAISQMKALGLDPPKELTDAVSGKDISVTQYQKAYLEALAVNYAKVKFTSGTRDGGSGGFGKSQVAEARRVLSIDKVINDPRLLVSSIQLAKQDIERTIEANKQTLNAPKRQIKEAYLQQNAIRQSSQGGQTIYALNNKTWVNGDGQVVGRWE